MTNHSNPDALVKTARVTGVVTVSFAALYCAILLWILVSAAPSIMALPFLPLLALIGFMGYRWRLAIGQARAARTRESGR